MDEKPNRFINNEEKPLDDNGFSSSSNHQNIDNFDDSSNKLQNDQSNQLNRLNPNMPKNINPLMNKQNQAKNAQNNSDNIKQKASLDKVTGGNLGASDSKPLFRKSLQNDGLQSSGIGSTINKFRHPIKSFFNRNKEQVQPESIDVAKTAKGMIKFVPTLAGILTALLPIIIIIILLVTLTLPLTFAIEEVKSWGATAFEKIGNFFKFNGFKTDKDLQIELYEKVDEVVATYSEISRETLLAALYYGFMSPEDYLDTLDVEDVKNNDDLDFGKMKKYTISIANQMVFSTVVFDNNIVKVDKTEVKNGQVVVVGYEFKCASGTEIYTSETELCDANNVAKYKDGPGSLDYSTADYCQNYVSDDYVSEFINDEKFNKDMKCVSIVYETDTENSKAKLENFLRYVMLPDTYFDKNSFIPDGYSWNKMVSKFSGIVKNLDLPTYNVPMHEVGPGKKIDYYTNLDAASKRRIDDSIVLVTSLIELARDSEKIENYHIPGNASLPLDFTIREPIEDTINKRVTSPFGQRKDPITGEVTTHRGVDFSWVTTADPVYSMLDGVVYSTSTAASDCGIGIIIGHDTDGDDQYDYYTRYCHLSTKMVNTGDRVHNGQQIGIMGSTGRSTGRHLHFEIRLSDFNTRVDPVPYLIDIVKNQSQFSNSPNTITQDNMEELSQKFDEAMANNKNTREGVAISASFLVNNLNKLPYFCGGYTTSSINQNWFKMNLVTNPTCSNYNTNANYGLDTSGFVSWALTQAGFANQYYTTTKLLELGDKIDMYDEKVQVGDLAYKGDKIGIIIELDESNAIVAYMDTTGLKATKVNRKAAASLFPNVISMDKFYKKG